MVEEVTEDSFLIKIEYRLSNLEDSVKNILDKGDEMNEVTQEKLSAIQGQLEKQAASMRKLRRKMYNPYNSKGVVCVILLLLILFAVLLYSAMGD
jgi:hypothetical protein